MATTTNYSWSTPDDTALVKDGAAAIRSLGTAIDSTVFTNAGAAINKSIVDAKGDLIAATAADTVSRLAVGSNDQVLTADSSTATGLKWAAPAAGGAGNMAQIATGTLSGASVTISSLSAYTDLVLFIYQFTNSTSDGQLRVAINNDTSSVYWLSAAYHGRGVTEPGRIIASNMPAIQPGNGYNYNRSTSQNVTSIKLTNCKNAGFTDYMSVSSYFGPDYNSTIGHGVYPVSAAVSSLVLSNSGGNFSAGTYYLWGA